MGTAAIICEYNPFHNGHQYQIEETRRQGKVDYILAIMSGNYVQRGEVALFDKWARTEMALAGGADLVVEIPSSYAASSAQYFAAAGVALANQSGVVDLLSFGSDSGDWEKLWRLAARRSTEDYTSLLRKALDEGLPYAHAVTKATGEENRIPPNDILGVEYLSALQQSASSIQPLVIQRKGAVHGADGWDKKTQTSSASAIRNALMGTAEIPWTKLMPEQSQAVIAREIALGRGPVIPERYAEILLAMIRSGGPELLFQLPFVSEGLEYRLYEAACRACTGEQLLSLAAAARYPTARIRRILTALLTGTRREDLSLHPHFPYLRVLGMRESAAPLMKELRQRCQVPVITQCGKEKKKVSPEGLRLLEQESRASDLYVLGYPEASQRKGEQEFTRPFLVYPA